MEIITYLSMALNVIVVVLILYLWNKHREGYKDRIEATAEEIIVRFKTVEPLRISELELNIIVNTYLNVLFGYFGRDFNEEKIRQRVYSVLYDMRHQLAPVRRTVLVDYLYRHLDRPKEGKHA